jgi:hypothetical protein
MAIYDALDPAKRYKGLPGQDMLAPVLAVPDFSTLGDSTGTMYSDMQPNTDALPTPTPIPPPTPLATTGPARQVVTAPPPAPSPDASWNGAKQVAPPVSPALTQLRALKPPAPPGKSYDANGNLVDDASTKPKWYQRLAAAALGGAAGYVNAAGRSYIPPAQVQQGEQNILAPGYAQKRAQYEQQRADLQGQASLDLQEQQQQALEEQREATAEWRKSQADVAAKAEADRAKATQQRIDDQQSATNQKFLEDQLAGRKSDSQYQQESDPRPAGYGFVPDPKRTGWGWATPPAWMKVTDDLAPYVAGRKIGDMIPWSEFKQAQKTAGASAINQEKPAKYDPHFQAYLDKNNGDIAKALADQQQDEVAKALALRQPKEPSAQQLAQQHKDTVRQLAQRAMNDSRAGGGSTYDDAIRNVQQFYTGPDETEMQENRDDVIAQLNAWKISGITPELRQAQADKAKNAGGAFAGTLVDANGNPISATGGRGGAPSAPSGGGGRGAPPAPAAGNGAPRGSAPPAPAPKPAPTPPQAAGPKPAGDPNAKITVKLPNGKFVTGTREQIDAFAAEAGLKISSR